MAADKEAIAEAELREEFEALARRVGIEILDDRRAAMLDSYRDLKRMTELLRAPLPVQVESANIFRIESIKRGR